MSAIFPTSTPWQVKHDWSTDGRTQIIGNVDGEIIDGTTHHTYDFVATTLDDTDDSQSVSVAVANADFIVRACNSHAALVEAAETLLATVELLTFTRKTAATQALPQHMADLRKVLTKARSAT